MEPESTKDATGERPTSDYLDGLVAYPNPPQGDDRIFVKGEPLRVTHGRDDDARHDRPEYAGKLYPRAALELLAAEAEGAPAAGSVDAALSAWLKANVTDPMAYLRELFQALQRRKCAPGLCARLNLACLTEPATDTVTVSRANGGTTKISRMRPGLDWLAQHAHFQVRRLCRGMGQPYLTQPKLAAERLEQVNNSFDLEQVLLVRIAYLASHAQLSQKLSMPPLALPGPT